MSGFNLPPGVSVSDIPGNGPDVRQCEVCGDDWPLDDENCPGCGSRMTTACDICEREIPETLAPALCQRCEQTARAHGRLEADAQRYPDPERRHGPA